MGRTVRVWTAALVVVAAACGGSPSGVVTSTRPPPTTAASTTTAEATTTTAAPATSAAPTTSVTSTTTTTTAAPTTTEVPPITAAPPTTQPPPTSPPTTAPPTAAPPAATVVRRGSTDRPVVAFTFDAGSDAGSTAAILDLLDAEGIRASFALTGDWAAANPALVRGIAARHRIVNHTADHRSFTGYSTGAAPLTRAERFAELRDADDAIAAIAGVRTRPWFRPPYGDLDTGAAADATAAGWPMIAMWTVDSLGWQGLDAASVAQRCLSRAGPGVIYLFHVGSQSTDIGALPTIVAGLRAAGYTIGGLDDVI